MMSQRILWLDNDPRQVQPYVTALQNDGFDVTVVTSAIVAEDKLDKENFDLLILDAMIPTKTEEEERLYTPEETHQGHRTGLVLFKRKKALLEQKRVRILVWTVRLDQDIQDDFLAAGLPKDNFATKLGLRETDDFLKKIHAILKA